MRIFILILLMISSRAVLADLDACAATNAETGCDFDPSIETFGPNGYTIAIVCPTGGGGECIISYENHVPDNPAPSDYRNPAHVCGSIVRVDQLASGESIEIVGTNETLNYVSNRSLGRTADYTFTLPLTNTPRYSNLSGITVEVDIAGQHYSYPYTTLSDGMIFSFTWDGKDGSGNLMPASAIATIKVHHYFLTPGVPDIPGVQTITVGRYKALEFGGLGGWSISSQHFYDPIAQKLYLGSGETQDASVELVTMGMGGEVQIVPSAPFDYYMVTNKDAKEAYLFDTSGKHVQTRSTITGAVLKTFTYTSGLLTSITDAYGKSISIARSSNTITITAPYGQVTTLALDGSNRVQSFTDPASHVWNLTYYSNNLLKTYEPPSGAISTFTYDGSGLLTEDAHSAGAVLDFLQNITYSANASYSTITMSTAEGPQTTYQVNTTLTGFERSENLPSSGVARYYGYSPNSNTYNQSPEGRYLTQSHSADPRFGSQDPYITGWSLSSGGQNLSSFTTLSTTFTSTDLLNLTSDSESNVTNSKTWARSYLGSAKTDTFTSPEGRVRTVQYNDANQTVQTQAYGYSPVVYAYDTDGRLHTITQSARVMTINYGTDGFVSSLQNAASKTTSMTYYLDGKVHTQTLPDSRILTYTYDADGNLASLETATSHTHSFLSNLYDLIQSYTAPSLGGSSYVTTFGYNNNRQLTLVTLPDSSTISYSYNSVTGRLDSYTTPDGTYNRTYNYFGQMTQITSPQSVTNGFSYDGDLVSFASTSSSVFASVAYHRTNFLTDTITVRDNSSSPFSISYDYDDDDLVIDAGDMAITRDATTGQISETDLGNIQELYSYDSTYGEVSTYQVKYSGTEIYKEQYTRDLLGRITTKVVTVNGSTSTTYDYTYDDNGRLHYVYVNSTLTRTYNYDDNSNRTSLVAGTTTSGTYDAQDRISTYGSNTYTETTNGYVSQITDGTNTTNLTYDTLGSLTSAQIITGAGTDNYTYLNDALGRRIERKKNGTLQKRYLYDEKGRLMAELDGSGNLVSQFIYATMSNSPDYMIQSGTKYKLIHSIVDTGISTFWFCRRIARFTIRPYTFRCPRL